MVKILESSPVKDPFRIGPFFCYRPLNLAQEIIDSLLAKRLKWICSFQSQKSSVLGKESSGPKSHDCKSLA